MKALSFSRVPPTYRETVLETIGIRLTSLSFCVCEKLDISDLSPCVVLEDLYVLRDSTISGYGLVDIFH